jgi:GINS complex subunit 2
MSCLSLKRITTAENEYLAENTMITVMSHINHEKFLFISGNFGPLEVGFKCQLPLWLAITLKKRGKCHIVIPDWLLVTSLEQNIINERSQEIFESLPFYFREISQLLLTNAREDFTSPDKVMALVQDIENTRMVI